MIDNRYLHKVRFNGIIYSTINNTMNNTITAQDLKTRGAQVLSEKTRKNSEAFITVRGEKSYVVLTINKYNYFRECELEAALKESESDLATGKFAVQTPEEHVKEIENV